MPHIPRQHHMPQARRRRRNRQISLPRPTRLVGHHLEADDNGLRLPMPRNYRSPCRALSTTAEDKRQPLPPLRSTWPRSAD
jgi:hypothetical protein